MIVGPPLYKEATEIHEWIVDFTAPLNGATVSGKVLRAIREVDTADMTTTLKQGTELEVNGVVRQLIKGGVYPGSYVLGMKVTDSNGLVYEAEQRLIMSPPAATSGTPVGAEGSIVGTASVSA